MASSNLKERATAVREDVSVRTKKSMWKRNDKEEILETERERERGRGMMVFKERGMANAKERNDNEWWFLDCLLIFLLFVLFNFYFYFILFYFKLIFLYIFKL
jgi:hypothetical protein